MNQLVNLLTLGAAKGYRTYLIISVIICMALMQKFLGIVIPNEVYIALFGLALVALRAATSPAGTSPALPSLSSSTGDSTPTATGRTSSGVPLSRLAGQTGTLSNGQPSANGVALAQGSSSPAATAAKTALVLLCCGIMLSGCGCATTASSAPASSTIDTLAATAGQAAALAWVTAKSPTASQQQSAIVVLQAVSTLVSDATNLDSFATAVTPLLTSAVATNALIPAADKPAVDEGITLVVAGADLYAGNYTGSLTNMATRAQFLVYFCNGAISVLAPSGTAGNQ